MKTDNITNDDIQKVEEQIKKLQAKKSELKKKEIMKRQQEIINTKIKLYDALADGLMHIYNMNDEQTFLHWLAETDINVVSYHVMKSIGEFYVRQGEKQGN